MNEWINYKINKHQPDKIIINKIYVLFINK